MEQSLPTTVTDQEQAVFLRLADAMRQSGRGYVIHEHVPVRTMAEADAARLFDVSRIVKTIAFRLRDGGLVLAALRGTKRVAYPALAGLVGVGRRDIAALSPDEVIERLGVAPGGVSPLMAGDGIARDHCTMRQEDMPPAAKGLRPLESHHNFGAGASTLCLDADVLTIAPTLYCGMGRPDRTLEIAPGDLAAMMGGIDGEFSKE